VKRLCGLLRANFVVLSLTGFCEVWQAELSKCRRQILYRGYYHFSGISRNLEMSGNLAEVRKTSGKGPKSENSRRKVREFCVSQGNLNVVTAQQNNLPVLYSYCN